MALPVRLRRKAATQKDLSRRGVPCEKAQSQGDTSKDWPPQMIVTAPPSHPLPPVHVGLAVISNVFDLTYLHWPTLDTMELSAKVILRHTGISLYIIARHRAVKSM